MIMRWLGTYLLTWATSFALAGAAPQHTFLVTQRAPHITRRHHHGWMLLTRGGSNEEPQSSSSTGTDSEEGEDSEEETQKGQTEEWSEEVDDDSAETDDDDNLDMFLDAQEFIEEENAAAEVVDKDIIAETIVETMSDDAIDDEYEYEDEEDDDSAHTVVEQVVGELNMEEVVEETVVQGAAVGDDLLDEYEDDNEGDSMEEISPETDFDKQITPQEDTPSTEDASQVEPEYSPGVETEVIGTVEEERVTETPANVDFDEPSIMSEPTVETVGPDTSTESMVDHAEVVEEDTSFVDTSQTTNIPVEVDLSQQHTTDDDSMAFEDRMQLADDEGEAALTEMNGEEMMEEEERTAEEATLVEDSAPIAAAVATDEEVAVDNEDAVTSAQAIVVLDDDTKRILRKDLKYHRREVNGMKPEIALVLAEKRLRRPCEGIPPNWYTEEAKHQQVIGSSRKKNIVLKIVTAPVVYAVPIVLGGLAIYGSRDVATMASTISSSRDSTPSPPPSDKDESVENKSILDTPPSTSMNTVESSQPPSTTDSGGIAPF